MLAGMTAANAMVLVDQTAVPLTLPAIMQDFGVGSAEAQWVLNASLLMLAGLLVLGGRLGDQIGRRRVFMVGCVLFAGGSALAGLAPAFPALIAARAVQGIGGAMMLPTSVSLLSSAYSADRKGRALGTMGGIAALAGAVGPTIGGVLTTTLSWRAVFLVNVPLALFCVWVTLKALPKETRAPGVRVDVMGAALFCVALIGVVYGFSLTQSIGLDSAAVVIPLLVSAGAIACFVLHERRAADPMLNLSLLRHKRNYLGATISQGLGGMAEMGLGVIFPLLLVLNLGMTPALAGLALIPSTLPMILLAPLTGRWYDRAGGRGPLVVGFAILAAAGVALAIGVQSMPSAGGGDATSGYLALLPGLLLYGIGLSIVLTANDPVTLDTIPDADEGQAAGVSATAEQAGGALGIAIVYALFHAAYVDQLHERIDASSLANLTDAQYEQLRAAIQHAEETGLRPAHFDPAYVDYLRPAFAASQHGYVVAFLTVAAIAAVGAVVTAWLVRRPAGQPSFDPAGLAAVEE